LVISFDKKGDIAYDRDENLLSEKGLRREARYEHNGRDRMVYAGWRWKVFISSSSIIVPIRINDMKRLFLVVLSIFCFSTCISVVKNDVSKSIISPNEKFVAISFIRSSGATTGFSPQVSILPKDKKLSNKSGNIFIGNNSKYIDIYWKTITL
jgi:hypothetical protein